MIFQYFFTNLKDKKGLQSKQNKKVLQSNQDKKIRLDCKTKSIPNLKSKYNKYRESKFKNKDKN